MTSRDAILAAVRVNRPAARERPVVPFFDDDQGGSLVERFLNAFAAMGGTFMPTPGVDPLAPLRDHIADAAVVVSMVPELAGTRTLDREARPASLADVDVAIVRAAFGVAETGSLAFTERELGVNTLAYLAQHLLVLLDPCDLVSNLHRAYHRPEFETAGYCVFHTGPSATADIEGVLIHGAQGVRSLTLAFVSRPG